jgi:hypothetical protein
MAGEWIPVDIALGSKPEVQELVDLSGQGVEVVVYRLLQLWGWASLNSADGTARATPERLARICGGDAAFWRSVESVGWLAFDPETETATIPGWGRRFSTGAKARACKNDRQRRFAGAKMAQQRHSGATRGEERTDSSSSPQSLALREPPAGPQEPATGPADASGWEILQAAWNNGCGARWRSPAPPQAAEERLAEPGWIARATAAVEHLPKCVYFRTPVTLPQFCGRGFVDRVLGGQYDKAKEPRSTGHRGPEDRPPAEGFRGDDAARFEATKKKLLEQLRIDGAA